MSSATLPSEDPRGWAIAAAKQDASFLISPSARARALAYLADETDKLALAAKTVLLDGGSQQGLDGYKAQPFDKWMNAADELGVFDRDAEDGYTTGYTATKGDANDRL